MNTTKGLWTATALVLPLVLVSSLIDAVTIPRMMLLLGMLLGTSIVLLKQLPQAFFVQSHTFLSSALGRFLGAYLLIGAFSLSMALSWSDGLVEWLKMWCWFSMIWLGSWLWRDEGSKLLWLKATGIAVFLVDCWGLSEFVAILHRLDEDKILYNVNAAFEHKNLMATGLVLSLPLTLLLYRNASDKFWKIGAAGTTLLSLVLILVTQSRAAWLGLAGATMLVLLLLMLTTAKRQQWLQPKYLGAGLVGLILSVGLAWSFSSQTIVANAPVKRIQAIFTYEDVKNEHTETIKERLFLWRNTMQMMQDHPILGVGLGNWKIHFPKYSVEGLRSEKGKIFFQRPHNDYLWVASETGLLGGLIYLGVFLVVLWYGWKLLRQEEIRNSAAYMDVLLMLGGVLAFALFGLVDFPKERPIHLLWSAWLIGSIAAYYYQYNTKEEKDTLGKFAYALPLVAFLGLFFMGQRWSAEAHCKKVLEARSEKRYATVLTELEAGETWAYQLDPAATPLSWYRGEALYLQGQLQAALAAFQKSNTLHPYHLHTLNNLGATYFGLNQLEASKRYFNQVLTFAPHFPDANMNLAAIAFNEGKTLEAVQYIGACVPMNYEDARFVQFLTAISQRYAQYLNTLPELVPIQNFVQQFATKQEWQVHMHQEAQKQNRSFIEQIHLDLLYVAQEEKIINSTQSDSLTSILNKLIKQ